MSGAHTYSHICHAPATARTQLAPTRRYARYAEICPVNPLTGICSTHRTALDYRHESPDGENLNSSFKVLPDNESIPATPPPFRHTPHHPWPQQATTVWRNLQQNPLLCLQLITTVWRNLQRDPRQLLDFHLFR